MARALTPQDCHVLLTAIARQATGQSALATVNTSNFVSVGETVLATGMENTYNAVSLVLNRLIIASRPYTAKLAIMDADGDLFSDRVRKISYFSKDPLADGAHNTQLFTNDAQGFTAGQNPDGNGDPQSTKSMWEQNQAMPYEVNFAGSSTWQDCITMYEVQVQTAFRSEAEFARFVAGYLQEHANDIEQQREAYRRMTLLSYLAGLYDVDAVGSTGQAINLRTAFNTKFNVTKSVQDLLTTDFEDFLKFLVSTIKQLSNMMEYRTISNHWSVPKTVGGTTYHILRHTPKDRQRLILYRPLLIDAESRIFPEIFNPQFLSIDNYEGVDFWQAEQSPMAINVTPSIPDVAGTNSGLQTTGSAVNLSYVIGVMYDADAVWDSNIWEDSLTSPIEAKKGYYNTIWHINHGSYIDYTEKGILLYMAD